MSCANVKECACPKTTCPNHKKCCACVIKHKETDSLPFCLFLDNEGDKSNENYYRKLKNVLKTNKIIGGIAVKPKVDMKRCFASKDVCMAIKMCPIKAVGYIEVDEPILDKILKCNCNEREALGLTPMAVAGYGGGCDCVGGCESESGDKLYDCGGNPYGRIIFDYDKCIECGICAKECCGSCIEMVDETYSQLT